MEVELASEASETSESATRKPVSRGVRMGAFIALTFAFALFDFLAAVAWFLTDEWQIPWATVFVMALVVVQVDLISFWTALGSGRMVVRLPWALLAMTLTYVLLLSGISTWGPQTMPAEERATAAGVLAYGWVAISLTLLIYRLATGRRLTQVDDSNDFSAKFHLRHLIAGTALCAATLAVLNWFGYPVFASLTPGWGFVFGIGLFSIVNLAITLPVIFAAFRWEFAWRWRILSLVGLTAAITVCEMSVLLAFGDPPNAGMLLAIYLTFNLTICLVLLFLMALLRSIGYELVVFHGSKQESVSDDKAKPAVKEADPWSEDE